MHSVPTEIGLQEFHPSLTVKRTSSLYPQRSRSTQPPAQVFIPLTILINFLELPDWELGQNSDLQVVELFSGVARIAQLASWLGYRTRAYDLSYLAVRNPYKRKRGKMPRSPMDLNGSAGLVFLWLYFIFFLIHQQKLWVCYVLILWTLGY